MQGIGNLTFIHIHVSPKQDLVSMTHLFLECTTIIIQYNSIHDTIKYMLLIHNMASLNVHIEQKERYVNMAYNYH